MGVLISAGTGPRKSWIPDFECRGTPGTGTGLKKSESRKPLYQKQKIEKQVDFLNKYE